jgi:hypothetical protein
MQWTGAGPMVAVRVRRAAPNPDLASTLLEGNGDAG